MNEHNRILARLDKQAIFHAIRYAVLCLLVGFIGFLVLRAIGTLDKKLDALRAEVGAEEK